MGDIYTTIKSCIDFCFFNILLFNFPLWSMHLRLFAYQPWRYKLIMR